MAVANSKSLEYVVLVHGTFAADEHDVKSDGYDRWWQRGSDFANAFEASLNAPPQSCEYKVAPNVEFQEDLRPWWAKPFFAKSPPIPGVFHWSGANSESARQQAGKRLLDYLETIERTIPATETPGEPRGYHLIAQSHGGIAAWEMLCKATRRNVQLTHLKSCTTVGTPFLRFKPDWLTCLLFPLAALLLLALLLWWQIPWWTDFWRQMAESRAKPWLVCGAFALLYVTLATIPALIARTAWSAYCWTLADSKACPDRYELERWDLWSSVLALVVAALILSGLSAAYWWHSSELFHEVRQPTTWLQWRPFLAVVWHVAVLAFLATCLARIVAYAWQYFRIESERTVRKETWEKWKGKYLAAGVSAAGIDEAISVLRALRRPIRGPMLPRFESPRADRYTNKRNRPRNPEQEQLRQGPILWLMQFLLLPLALVWHWIAQPLYNEVVAGLIDDFVLSRIRRSAIGEDVLGLKLSDVSVHPIDQIAPAQMVPSEAGQAVRKDIEAQVAKQAEHFLKSVRRLLGQPWTGGIGFQRFFERAMAGKPSPTPKRTAEAEVVAGAVDVLVHTNYFYIDALNKEILGHMQNPGTAPFEASSASGAATDDDEDDSCRKKPSLGDMLWWSVRSLVWLMIALLPLEVLTVWGERLAYPYSAQSAYDWAISVVKSKALLVDSYNRIRVSRNDKDYQEQNLFLPRVIVATWLTDGFSIDHASLVNEDNVGSQIIFYGHLAAQLAAAGQVAAASDAFYKCQRLDTSGDYLEWIQVKAQAARDLHSNDRTDSDRLESLLKIIARDLEKATSCQKKNREGERGSLRGLPRYDEGKTSIDEIAASLKSLTASTDAQTRQRALSPLNAAVNSTSLRNLPADERSRLLQTIENSTAAVLAKSTDLETDALLIALLSVLHFREGGAGGLSAKWVREMLELAGQEGSNFELADKAKAICAAAFSELGFVGEMRDAFSVVANPKSRLTVASQTLCRIARSADPTCTYFPAFETFDVNICEQR